MRFYHNESKVRRPPETKVTRNHTGYPCGWRGYRQKLSVGKIRRFSGHRTQPCLEI